MKLRKREQTYKSGTLHASCAATSTLEPSLLSRCCNLGLGSVPPSCHRLLIQTLPACPPCTQPSFPRPAFAAQLKMLLIFSILHCALPTGPLLPILQASSSSHTGVLPLGAVHTQRDPCYSHCICSISIECLPCHHTSAPTLQEHCLH